MKPVLVAAFNEVEPAQQLQKRLRLEGMESCIKDESKVERFWFMAEPLAAIHVEVDQDGFVNARKLIEQLDVDEGILSRAVRCPECKSPRVQYPQITRKFIMPVFEAFLMALKILPREFYCWDCQYTWPKDKPKKRKKEDALGWPVRSKS